MAASLNFSEISGWLLLNMSCSKVFFQHFLSTSFLYKEEVGEKEGLGWIFLEQLLKCLNKHPTFVYIPLLTINV